MKRNGRWERWSCRDFAILVVVAAILFQVPGLAAGPGEPDGIEAEIDGLFSSGGQCFAVAVQLDGKILLGGWFDSVQGVTRNNLARLNADGSLDMGFDPSPSASVSAVNVLPDGRILIAGGFSTLKPNGAATEITRRRIAILRPDGSVDPDFDPNASGPVLTAAVQQDGRILVGGSFTSLQPNGAASPTPRKRIARLLPDGTLDPDFDPSANDDVCCIALQDDGKILLGGEFVTFQPNGTTDPVPRSRIARLHPGGTVDPGFDPSVVESPFSSNTVLAIATQADGRIVIGGDFTSLRPNGAADSIARDGLARLNTDGSLDPSVGITTSEAITIHSLGLQSDGKILAGGWISSMDTGLIRLHSDGTRDTDFDPKPNSLVYAMCLQGDGRIVIGGRFAKLQPNGAVDLVPRRRFARLLNDPTTEALYPIDPATVSWTRGGSAPEMSGVSFEISTDGGASWARLGDAGRFAGSSEWRLSGLTLPTTGRLRARGRSTGGRYNGSGAWVESLSDFHGHGAPPPEVHEVSPVSGSTAGGTTVTITGVHFSSVTGVTFGEEPALGFEVVDSTTIRAVTPAKDPGLCSVLVSTDTGGVNQPGGHYTFGPSVFDVSPASGSPRGGTPVTITGRDFEGATGVTFNGAPARSVVLVDQATLTAVTPPGAEGDAKVVVHAALGASAAEPRYQYTEPPRAGFLDDWDLDIVGTRVVTTATLPNGKVLIGGTFTSVAGVERNHIARLNPDGSLDSRFNLNLYSYGYVHNVVNCIAVQGDGKILIGGDFNSLQPSGSREPVERKGLARIHPNGSLDLAFNPMAEDAYAVHSIELQADGEILVGGGFTNVAVDNDPSEVLERPNVCRLNADGSLDAGFYPNPSQAVQSIVALPDGKVLIGGEFGQFRPGGVGYFYNRHHIARLNADGSLDGGYLAWPEGGEYVGTFRAPRMNDNISCIALQPDGKILIGGRFRYFNDYLDSSFAVSYSYLARLHADGTLDMDFNPGPNGWVTSMALQADDKIVIAGGFDALAPNEAVDPVRRRRFARLHPDGSLDMDFDPGAWEYSGYSVDVQPDGHILVGGQFTRLQPNGAEMPTDRSFFARLSNDLPFESVYVMNATTVRWERGGSSPELGRVIFERSPDGGATWVTLGSGRRVGTGSDWQLSRIPLPPEGLLRAAGQTVSGSGSGSRGWIRSEAVPYSGPGTPDIALEDPDGTALTSARSMTDVGAVAVGGHRLFPITIRNEGAGDLLGVSATLGSGEVDDYAIVTPPPATIPAGASAVMTVRFEPSALWSRSTTLTVTSNDPDEKPFELGLTGQGVSPAGMLAEALENAGLGGVDASPGAMPLGDGLENLIKYAFNMDLSGPDGHRMEKDGASGLPSGRLVDGASVGKQADEEFWMVQFVRCRSNGLTYRAMKSADLGPGPFAEMEGEVRVESIDGDWERVTILEPFDPSRDPRVFTRVEVTLP